MGVRTVTHHKRRCSKSGKRTEFAAYLVSELSEDGLLPAIVLVGPIPFDPPEDKPLRRIPIVVDLDILLAGGEYSEYIAGPSAERFKNEKLQAPEIAAYGMPLKSRTSIGFCAVYGLEALQRLYPTNIRNLGYYLRSLSRTSSIQEISRTLVAFAKQDWPQVLASLWRAWRSMPNNRKDDLYSLFASSMISLGAMEDAMELRR